MKYVVIFTLLLTAASWAKSPELLKCLGEEEKRLHLNKDTGPAYELNQRLIAEMVQIPNASVKQEYYNIICTKKDAEALKLLELSIDKGKDIFEIPSELTGMQRQITEGMIDDYIEASKEIFLNYISQIQAIAPTSTCLKEEIPLLETFFREIKYLQEDVNIKTLFEKKEEKIFEQLKSYPRAFQRCRDRAKKKPKSGSTSAAK